MKKLPSYFRLICTVAGVALGSLLPSRASAAPAPYPISVSSQDQRAPSVQTFQAEPRTFRVTFKDGTNVSDVSSATVFMGWATNAYANTYVTSTWSKVNGGSNGVVDFTFSASSLNTNGTLIYFVGAGSTYRQGALTIAPNPWSTGVSAPTTTSNINMDVYTWTGGPFVRIGDTVTDDVARAWAVAASNLAASVSAAIPVDARAATGTVDLAGNLLDGVQNVRADGSSGIALQNSSGSNVVSLGAGGGTGVSMSGGVNIAGVIDGGGRLSGGVISNSSAYGLATDAELAGAQADVSNQFVSVAGDTMTGALTVPSLNYPVGLVLSNVTFIYADPGGVLELENTAWRGTDFTYHDGLNVFEALRIKDANSNTVATITSTNFKFGANSFNINASGDISQDATNTATLGVVSATSFSGDGSGLTNLPIAITITTNAVTPSAQGNTGAEWTINLTAGGVLVYTQDTAITNILFTVADTNAVTAGEVILLTDTNSITFPASIIWAEGSAPTTDASDYERFVFSLYRDKITGAYLEDD